MKRPDISDVLAMGYSFKIALRIGLAVHMNASKPHFTLLIQKFGIIQKVAESSAIEPTPLFILLVNDIPVQILSCRFPCLLLQSHKFLFGNLFITDNAITARTVPIVYLNRYCVCHIK